MQFNYSWPVVSIRSPLKMFMDDDQRGRLPSVKLTRSLQLRGLKRLLHQLQFLLVAREKMLCLGMHENHAFVLQKNMSIEREQKVI